MENAMKAANGRSRPFQMEGFYGNIMGIFWEYLGNINLYMINHDYLGCSWIFRFHNWFPDNQRWIWSGQVIAMLPLSAATRSHATLSICDLTWSDIRSVASSTRSIPCSCLSNSYDHLWTQLIPILHLRSFHIYIIKIYQVFRALPLRLTLRMPGCRIRVVSGGPRSRDGKLGPGWTGIGSHPKDQWNISNGRARWPFISGM